MQVARGEGVKESQNFAEVMYGSLLICVRLKGIFCRNTENVRTDSKML